MFFSSYIIKIIAPGFIGLSEIFNLTNLLFFIMFPYILLISISSLFSSVLNSWGHFLIPTISPILLNIVMIIFLIFFRKYFNPPILSLAYSVLIGGILQIVYQILFLKKINMLVLPRINIKDSGIITLIKKFFPAIISISIHQISFIMNNIFSSFLISGSISWIYYADRLMEFPVGILGITLNTILLTNLSKKFLNNNKNEYLLLINWGIRMFFVLVLPSTLGLALLAEPIIITLFKYGKFSYFDVLMTKNALIVYSLGLPGIILTKILNTVFYSQQDIKTPIKISIICFIFTQVANPILIIFFKHVGLVISISISAYLNAILLYLKINRKNFFSFQKDWFVFFLKLFIALIMMSIFLLIVNNSVNSWEINSINRFFNLFLICLSSGLSYIITLFFLGFKKNIFLYNFFIKN